MEWRPGFFRLKDFPHAPIKSQTVTNRSANTWGKGSGFGHVSGFGDRGWLTTCPQGHLTQCGGPALICPSWLFSLLWCPWSPSPNFGTPEGQCPGSPASLPLAQGGAAWLSWCPGLPLGLTLPAA